MVTLFRAIRLWQLKIKWKLAVMRFIDKQAKEILKNPEEAGKKAVSALNGLLSGGQE